MLNSSDQTPDERQRGLRRRAAARRAVSILAAFAVSAGAAACGSADGGGGDTSGDEQALSQEEYLKEVNAAQTEFASDAAKLNLADPSSARQFGNSLGDLEKLIETLRTRLDQVAEPEAVTTEQDTLVRELGDYGDAIRQQKDALTSGDPERAAAAARKVGRASTEFSRDFDATIEQINENLGLEGDTASSRD